MNFEAIFMLSLMILGMIGCILLIRINWKRYGLLFLISLISANLICYIFTYVGFYSFPNNIFHNGFLIPYGLVSSVFPFVAMFGVRYSPQKWVWKIPFYWGIIHLGVLAEFILKRTSIFRFEPYWDLWDSYTIWWIYYLLFEILGGKIVPDELRKPIDSESFRYGRWAWIIFHVIVIATIFLAGIYVGITVFK